MKILVVTGKSGGHIFPAMAFLEELQEIPDSVEAILALPKQDIESRRGTRAFKICYLSIRSIRLQPRIDTLVGIALFFKGCFESLFILCTFRPDVVVSFGSLVGIPVVFFSRLTGVKRVVLHEQNVIPGRAQRVSSLFADRIAVSFEETRRYLKPFDSKIVFTGNLRRRDLTKIEKSAALKFFSLKDKVCTVLVMGGSQGSRTINAAFLKAARVLSAKSRFQIVHLTGMVDYEPLQEEYKKLSVDSRVFPFLAAMQYALSAADLVLSRAGATTISELQFYRIPAILVPYPYAYQHQWANAQVLKGKGAAVVIRDGDLDSGVLERNLEELIRDEEKRKAMKAGYESFPRLDSNKLFLDAVLN